MPLAFLKLQISEQYKAQRIADRGMEETESCMNRARNSVARVAAQTRPGTGVRLSFYDESVGDTTAVAVLFCKNPRLAEACKGMETPLAS